MTPPNTETLASIRADDLDAAPPAPGAEALPTTVILPAGGWQLVDVGELWRFRELLFFLCWRDVKVRYKQTVLGAAWAILQPLMMMVVFTVFFSRLAHVSSGSVPYPLFAFTGLLPWTFFATAVANAGNSVVGSERLITKIYFPRLAVPFASVGAAVVDFVVAMALMAALMVYYRDSVRLGPGLLLAPLIFGVIVLAALGVGTLLSALNVAYRDFRYVIPFLIQLWMFATPTIYMQPAEALGPADPPPTVATRSAPGIQADPSRVDGGEASVRVVKALLAANPMTALIASFRAALLGGPIPWRGLGGASALVVLVFLAGCLYFRKVEDAFADII